MRPGALRRGAEKQALDVRVRQQFAGGPVQHQSARLERDRVPSFDAYPFAVPAVRALDELAFDPAVTFFVGENGSGKSTLVEALAVACGFNAEGGTKNFRFATRRSESELRPLA